MTTSKTLRAAFAGTLAAAALAAGAAPAAASSDADAPATAAAADRSHCFIFRPTPQWILVYVACRADEILGDGGTAA